jgi:hypothetical protein
MEFNELSIANFIYDLLKFDKMCKKDLEYAFNLFLKNEEYEKCSVIKELIELKYYDNRKRNHYESILKVEELVKKISSGELFADKKEFFRQRERIKKLKENIETFYTMLASVSKDQMIIPPFKNEINRKYFYNI